MSFKDISEIFYFWSSGIGLLLAGIGGLKWLFDRSKQLKLKGNFEYFQDKFPYENLNQSFELFKEEPGNRVFIHDKETNKLHWIRNQSTRNMMGFGRKDYTLVLREKIKKYQRGDDIIAP